MKLKQQSCVPNQTQENICKFIINRYYLSVIFLQNEDLTWYNSLVKCQKYVLDGIIIKYSNII